MALNPVPHLAISWIGYYRPGSSDRGPIPFVPGTTITFPSLILLPWRAARIGIFRENHVSADVACNNLKTGPEVYAAPGKT